MCMLYTMYVCSYPNQIILKIWFSQKYPWSSSTLRLGCMNTRSPSFRPGRSGSSPREIRSSLLTGQHSFPAEIPDLCSPRRCSTFTMVSPGKTLQEESNFQILVWGFLLAKNTVTGRWKGPSGRIALRSPESVYSQLELWNLCHSSSSSSL